jgi:outer membrane immunogenic protein
MKKAALTFLTIFTFCGLACAGPESLSGKEMKQVAAPPACEISWTGFYIGAHAGYGFGQADTEVTPLPVGRAPAAISLDPDENGFFGGIQAGYNHQFSSFVLGLETDFSGSTIDGSRTGDGAGYLATVHQDIDWLGTFRGRVGFTPTCRLLLYATGGLAYGDVHDTGITITASQYPGSRSEVQLGWTAGAGAEFALNKRWSLKFEYLYYDLGDKSVTANPVAPNPPFQTRYNWETMAHTVNGGLNFHF